MKTKAIIVNVFSVIFGLILLYTAYNHIANPDFYSPMIPSFISDFLAHAYSVITEAMVGVALLLPRYRKYGALGFTLLMLTFLPIHIWDLFRENHAENPLLPTMRAAVIRFIIQIIFIAIGYWMYRFYKSKRILNY